MRYKGFYIKISPDSNIRRVDKKGRDILCEGFLIQVFADETERVEIDNFSAAVGFEIQENSFAEAVQFAKDYVECMWLILQNDKPEDFVIATGVQHSVREFCQLAFHEAGIELEFKGEGMDEKGYDKATGKVVIEVSPDFYRPTDVVNLWGDPTKAKTELGWNPAKTSFEELVKIMVQHDMKKVAVERAGEYVACNLEEYLEKGVVK